MANVLEKPVLILGCGNTLLGDDGFGPAVIELLQREYLLPPHVAAEDVGTSMGGLLFDLLLRSSPARANSRCGRRFAAGTEGRRIVQLCLDDFVLVESNGFSFHQFPSISLLHKLATEGGVLIRVLAVQAGNIPDEVRPGMTPEVEAAVPEACAWLWSLIEGDL